MSISILDALNPASELAIARAQQALQTIFSDDYLKFLRTYNGGRAEPDSFAIHWESKPAPSDHWRASSMSWFYGIGDPVDSTNLVEVNKVEFRGRLPAGTFAFANDAGGNQLLFASRGPYAGKILFWCKDHEVEQGETPDYENVGVVADSFQDLLDNKLF